MRLRPGESLWVPRAFRGNNELNAKGLKSLPAEGEYGTGLLKRIAPKFCESMRLLRFFGEVDRRVALSIDFCCGVCYHAFSERIDGLTKYRMKFGLRFSGMVDNEYRAMYAGISRIQSVGWNWGV